MGYIVKPAGDEEGGAISDREDAIRKGQESVEAMWAKYLAEARIGPRHGHIGWKSENSVSGWNRGNGCKNGLS
jgi:hypothetical protein